MSVTSLLRWYVYFILVFALIANTGFWVRLSVILIFFVYFLLFYPGFLRVSKLLRLGVLSGIILSLPLLVEVILGLWSVVVVLPLLWLVDLYLRGC